MCIAIQSAMLTMDKNTAVGKATKRLSFLIDLAPGNLLSALSHSKT